VLLLQGPGTFRSRLAADGLVADGRPLPDAQVARGHLTPDNVRLAHRLCNSRDYEWRTRINEMLRAGMSLDEIATALNARDVPTIHGTDRWTPASVRRAFVS
jgi:hypothetical protein